MSGRIARFARALLEAAGERRAPAARRYVLLAAALAFVVPVLVYLPATRYGFLYDDVPLVVENAAIHDLGHLGAFFARDVEALRLDSAAALSNYYRPLAMVVLALLWGLAGASPAAWHAAVMLLHAAAGVLAMGVLRSHRLPLGAALAGSLLFSLHPAHVESVAWVSGVQDVLLGVVAVAAYVLYRGFVERSGVARAAAMALAFAAGLGVKEAALGLPVLVGGQWLLQRWLPPMATTEGQGAARGEAVRRQRTALLVLLALAAGYLALRWTLLGALARPFPTAPSLSSTAATLPLAIATYLRYLLWPVGLALHSPLRPVTWSSPAALAGVAACIVAAALLAWWWRRRPAAALPVLWFAAWLLPCLNLWALNPEWIVMDRYLYLPVLALPWALLDPRTGPRRAPLRWSLAAALGAGYLVLTLARLPVYRDEAAFWNDAVDRDPGSSVAWTEVGRLRAEAGNRGAARSALERAYTLDPRSLLAQLRLGNLSLAEGRAAEAADWFARAVAGNAGYRPAAVNLPGALLSAGRPREAVTAARQAAARWPDDAQVLDNLGVALHAVGLRDEALAHYTDWRRRQPGNAIPAARRALLLAEAGRSAEAAAAAAEALALGPPPALRPVLDAIRRGGASGAGGAR